MILPRRGEKLAIAPPGAPAGESPMVSTAEKSAHGLGAVTSFPCDAPFSAIS